MKLNCKPGDLAVVVGSCLTAGMRNRFVIVCRAAKKGDVFISKSGNGVMWGGAEFGNWVIKPAAEGSVLPWTDSDGCGLGDFDERVFSDLKMRPIRPSEGEDQTLTWAGNPEKVTA